MSRNYQFSYAPGQSQFERDEGERFDAYDRAQERREAMAREQERDRLAHERQAALEDIHRPLSECELRDLKIMDGG